MYQRLLRVIVAAGVCIGVGGCASTRMTELESENRALSAQARAQTTEIENLRAHHRKLADELARAEAIAAHYQTEVERHRALLAAYQHERETVYQQLSHWTPLQPPPAPPRVIEQFQALARKLPALRYDPAVGVGKLETDVMFDSGRAELKPGAAELLRQLARYLASPEAAELRVVVMGHADPIPMAHRPARDQWPTNLHLSAARALAVADCLRQAGLSEERLSVVGCGAQWPAESSAIARDFGDPLQSQRRVEVCVVSADVPMVGRFPPPGAFKR